MPATAVIVRGDGLQVAEVDDSGAIRLQKVQVGRDLGKSVEIVAGLNDGARIVTNPSDTLVDGTRVRVADLSAQNTTASGKQLAKR